MSPVGSPFKRNALPNGAVTCQEDHYGGVIESRALRPSRVAPGVYSCDVKQPQGRRSRIWLLVDGAGRSSERSVIRQQRLGRNCLLYSTSGECVGPNGDVFIVKDGTGKIFEYAHGGKQPLKILESSSGDPIGCSVDAATGDLAVASLGIGVRGTVAIYKMRGANPQPTRIQSSKNTITALTIVSATFSSTAKIGAAISNLPSRLKGGSAFMNITLNQSIGWPGGVEWDGKYVLIGDQGAPVIYRFAINGSRGTKISSIPLGSGVDDVHQFFVQGKTLIAPNLYFNRTAAHSDVLFYDYPAGGKAFKKITRDAQVAQGAVVSRGQLR